MIRTKIHTKSHTKSPTTRQLALLLLSASALLMAGCSMSSTGTTGVPAPITGAALQGKVFGGQQPVVGAKMQLYAVGLTGYGSASRALIASTVTSGPGGTFNITGTYTCQPTDLVYLVASGGNPGVAGTQNNSGLALMTGLGLCSSLSTSQFIQVNELTTVASVWALAPFMKDTQHIGASATNALGISNAFNSIGQRLVSIPTGTIPGPSLPVGATLPVAEINTLADVIASCVNTVDSGGAQSSACTSLFAAAQPPLGAAPIDTVRAAMNIAQNPTLNVATLNGLSGGLGAPFQPILGGAPTSWTIAINYPAPDITPNTLKGIAVNPGGTVYAVGAGANPDASHTNSLIAIPPGTGAISETHLAGTATLNQPSAIAIDMSGTLWITDSANNSVLQVGATTVVRTNGGLNAPNAVAIDPAGNVWITNGGNGTVSEFNSAGSAVSSASGFSTGAATQPTAIAINPK